MLKITALLHPGEFVASDNSDRSSHGGKERQNGAFGGKVMG
jgi:hypothetical protein